VCAFGVGCKAAIAFSNSGCSANYTISPLKSCHTGLSRFSFNTERESTSSGIYASRTSVVSKATGKTAIKPVVIDHYNQFMNGVDLADQYTTYYFFIHKSRKWWKKVCFWLLKVVTVNSYILYRSKHNNNTHLQYQRAIIESLALIHLKHAPERVRGRRFTHYYTDNSAIVNQENLNRKPHFFAKRENPCLEQGQCVVYCTPKKRKRSSCYCKTCPSKPNLCPDTCNEKYHSYKFILSNSL